MNKKAEAIAVASIFLGNRASALKIADWDMGQFIGAGAMSTDGGTLATSLSANDPDYDPTFGAGLEFASRGTRHIDGTVGSTIADGANIVPTSGSLTSTIAWPQNNVPAGDVQFDAASIQNAEGASGLPDTGS